MKPIELFEHDVQRVNAQFNCAKHADKRGQNYCFVDSERWIYTRRINSIDIIDEYNIVLFSKCQYAFAGLEKSLRYRFPHSTLWRNCNGVDDVFKKMKSESILSSEAPTLVVKADFSFHVDVYLKVFNISTFVRTKSGVYIRS